MNWFDSESAARQYARGRPYYHELVMERVAAHLKRTEPLGDALDVGCGTGLSTRALKHLALRVVGVDISPEMIAQAPQEPNITYRVGPGETLPVADAAFALVTIASAFHWLDRERFYAEVRRVLRPEGYFVIYENGFFGQMAEEPSFAEWAKTVHLVRYPSPPRHVPFAFHPGDPAGFELIATERYENDVDMTATQLVEYLLTQSNAIAVLESGRETLEETRAFLEAEIPSFYGPDLTDCGTTSRRLRFGGVYWILRRISE